MRRRRAIFVTALAVVAAAVFGVVFADDLTYMYQDNRNKDENLDGYENLVVYNWAIKNKDIVWKADPAIRSDVITAINNWTHHFDELGWTEGSSDVNVTFVHQKCNGSAGKIKIKNLGSSAWKRVGDANYLNKAEICVSSTRQFVNTSSHNGRVAVIAHEIGHVYGLADRYLHSPVVKCNNKRNNNDGEVSILDAMREVSVTNTALEHCDGIEGPATSTDVARVRTLYSKGSLPELTATTTNHIALSNGKATGATISWEDAAWAESEHRIRLYIEESTSTSTSTKEWRHFYTEIIEDRIGTHRDILGVPANTSTKPYELSHDFSPQEFSAEQGNEKLPDVANYRFCSAPYFEPFKKEGTTNCPLGSVVELVNPWGELSATTSTVSVGKTMQVNLTNLYPDDFGDFSVKVSGLISNSGECRPPDEFLNAASSISVSGCSAGEGKVTLLSKPHAVTLAELTITVQSNSQTPTITPVSLFDQYDANGNGRIDRDEVIEAIRDYLFNRILTRDEVIEIIRLYLLFE